MWSPLINTTLAWVVTIGEAALVDCLEVSKQHEKGKITGGDTDVCEESGAGVRDSLLPTLLYTLQGYVLASFLWLLFIE